MEKMGFELWLFVVKKFAQTFDMAREMYEQMSDDEKKVIQKEYALYLAE